MAGPSNFPPQMPPQYPQRGPMPPFRPQYPPKQGNPLKIVLIVGGIIFGLLFLGGLAVGILAVAVLPKIGPARVDLERKQLRDLHTALEQATIEPANRKKLAAMKDKAGREFWSDCFKKKVLDDMLLRKIVCMGSAAGDVKAESSFIEDPNGELLPSNCSFTSPKASELFMVMNLKGPKRVVLITFDSRNWRSYPDKGVLCAWSDGTQEWMTLEQAQAEYGISQTQWSDPAQELFGKKHPFEYTHEK